MYSYYSTTPIRLDSNTVLNVLDARGVRGVGQGGEKRGEERERVAPFSRTEEGLFSPRES